MKIKFKAIIASVVFIVSAITSANAGSVRTEHGNLLHCYANTGNTAKIISLHHLNEGWINEKNADGDFPINCATTYGMLKCLVACGADVNAKGSRGRTPLYRFIIMAAVSGDQEYIDAVNYLLDKHASIHITDQDNHTPLDWLRQSYMDRLAKGLGYDDITMRMETYYSWLCQPEGRILKF